MEDGKDPNVIDLNDPQHEWLRIIAEVYRNGRPEDRPRERGETWFPSTRAERYGRFHEQELYILAAWHAREFFQLEGESRAGYFCSTTRRQKDWHDESLGEISAALGEEFGKKLGGFFEHLDALADREAEAMTVGC